MRLKRLYDANKAGVADLDDPALKDRIVGLKATRDQTQADGVCMVIVRFLVAGFAALRCNPASWRTAGVQAEWVPSRGTGCTEAERSGGRGSWAEGTP